MFYTRARSHKTLIKFVFLRNQISSSGESKNSCMVAKDYAPIIDITWPPSNPRAVHSRLTVSGEILGKLRPYLESGILKAVIDPAGPFHFSHVPKAFGHLETGRARGKVVITSFPACSRYPIFI